MRDMPANRYVYVGDNPVKDFVAPNELGWMTVGLKAGVRNIHTQVFEKNDCSYTPFAWIDALPDLFELDIVVNEYYQHPNMINCSERL